MERLIEKVLIAIEQDISEGNYEALKNMLAQVDTELLLEYLSYYDEPEDEYF